MVVSDRITKKGTPGADRVPAQFSPQDLAQSESPTQFDFFERKTTVVALVGPQSSGKSTLARALTGSSEERSGGRGNPKERSKPTAAGGAFVGLFQTIYGRIAEGPVLVDCSGATDDFEESVRASASADLALVVVDAQVSSVTRAVPYLRMLTEMKKPHIVFINRVDDEGSDLDSTIAALSRVSAERTLIQQYPLTQKHRVAGAVLLWNESASLFTADGEKVIPLPEETRSAEAAARQEFLESLSDFDDRVLIDLLDERLPAIRVLAQDLRAGLSADAFVPIYFGSAVRGFGLRHLSDALRGFDAELAAEGPVSPARSVTVQSADAASEDKAVLHYLQQGEFGKRGRACLFRVEAGHLSTGCLVDGQRFGSLFVPGPEMGTWSEAAQCPEGGVFLALKVTGVDHGSSPGDLSSQCDPLLPEKRAAFAQSHFAQAVKVLKGSQPEKVIQCLERLSHEDPSLRIEHTDLNGGETVLVGAGQGQLDRVRHQLHERFALDIELASRAIDYRERLGSAVYGISGRYKHQNGGHGAFGDVVMNFIPADPGAGVVFREEIAGGVVPKQYFSAVEAGAREALLRGCHGYPLVDLEVVLVDGSYHSVDSSEMAFRNAGRLAVRAMLEQVGTTLLEPYLGVSITLPESQMGAALQVVASLRGQVNGYVMSERLPEWNEAYVVLPEAELAALIRTVRSQSQGLGFFDVRLLEADKRFAPVRH
jgi:elongation factor G